MFNNIGINNEVYSEGIAATDSLRETDESIVLFEGEAPRIASKGIVSQSQNLQFLNSKYKYKYQYRQIYRLDEMEASKEERRTVLRVRAVAMVDKLMEVRLHPDRLSSRSPLFSDKPS